MILAIDPGETTGIAACMTSYDTCTLTTHEEVWDYVELMGVGPDHNQIVIERFISQAHLSKYGLRTIELIGGVKALAWQKKIPIALQTPAQRIPFEPRAREILKAVHKKYITDHEVSALAHLLCWRYKNDNTFVLENNYAF